MKRTYLLNELHRLKGKTHAEVASAIGVSRSSYTGYLTGHQKPSLEVAIRLGEYFKVPVESIVFQAEGR